MLKKRLFLLLLLTVAFAFSIRLFIPRYQVYKHIDETMIIDEKKTWRRMQDIGRN